MTQRPKAPDHLSAAMREWWRSVHVDYQLELHHQHLLKLACETYDQHEAARAILAVEGLTVVGTDGSVKAHPAVAIARDARIAFTRLLRELDLDVEPPGAERSRPPALFSNRRLK